MNSRSPLQLSFALASLLSLACGPTPVPITPEQEYASQQHSADDGHDHGEHFPGDGHDHGPGPVGGVGGAAMPQDATHAGLVDPRAAGAMGDGTGVHGESGEGESYSGVVRLQGELAAVGPSYLFISVMPEGSNMPGCFSRLDLNDPEVGTLQESEEGANERVIGFHFPSCPIPGDGPVELKVQWDGDGLVRSENDREIAKRYPVERGDEDIAVALSEADE